MIRTEIQDGKEIIDYVLKVFRDDTASRRDRNWACEWLADRAFGKPPQIVEDIDQPVKKTSWDFSKLTLEELEIFEPLLDKVRRLNTGEPGEPLSSLPRPPLAAVRPDDPADEQREDREPSGPGAA